MRIIASRFRSQLPSLVIALACNSSWTSTSSAFIPSSIGAIRAGSYTTTSTTTFTPSVVQNIRGGSNLHSAEESIKGEQSSSSEKKKAVTGWNHKLPDETSPFWKGKKELPKNLADQESTGSESETETETAAERKERLKTGWLHKTKKAPPPKQEDKANTGNTARFLLEQAMMEQKVNHRIISPPTFHAVGEGRRVVITEHKLAVPLDRYNPPTDPKAKEPMVDIYFCIVELITTPEDEKFFQELQSVTSGVSTAIKQREMKQRAAKYKAFTNLKDAKDCMIYLQGGPGFGAPVPINGIGLSDKSSWLGAALSKGYNRVVLMDQRGTGKSSTITKQTLQKSFPDLFLIDDDVDSVVGAVSSMSSVEADIELFMDSREEDAKKVKTALGEAVQYMSHFRADNIVKDAEAVKEALLQLPVAVEEGQEALPRPWGCALGQSFGGFCMMTYLSLIPNPPMICLLTGGIAPMLTNVDELYPSVREKVKERNMKYYERYPGDVDVVKRIVSCLDKAPPKLPSGGLLTARRFQQLGLSLGGSPSAFASLHALFASAFVSDEEDEFARAFLKEMDSTQPFDDYPLYFLMHETIYADKSSDCVKTEWSAQRASDNEVVDSSDPVLFTGEVVFPWMADGDYAELSGLGMRALAHALATKDDWGLLYDADHMKAMLAVDGTGRSKAAAAVYYEDMYVDFDACMKVCKRGGPLENCQLWISNEYQHSGLRDDGAVIFNKLIGIAKGEVGTPS